MSACTVIVTARALVRHILHVRNVFYTTIVRRTGTCGPSWLSRWLAHANGPQGGECSCPPCSRHHPRPRHTHRWTTRGPSLLSELICRSSSRATTRAHAPPPAKFAHNKIDTSMTTSFDVFAGELSLVSAALSSTEWESALRRLAWRSVQAPSWHAGERSGVC